MRSTDLASTFRRILTAALAAAPAATLSACFVSVAPVDPIADGAADGARDASADAPGDDGTPWLGCPVVTSGDAPDGAVNCSASVSWSCGAPSEVAAGNSIELSVCQMYCPQSAWGSTPAYCYAQGDGGAATLVCNYCAAGRRTEGMTEPDACVPGEELGTFLANAATLEAASVTAFERLRDELGAYGAPEALLAALARAADDERDHAARVTRAALRRGVEPQAPRIERHAGVRALVEIARENAVEGCVRETLGALVVAWQAQRAGDAALRAMYARLAVDEASHAALSFALHDWLVGRLSAHERAEVERARNAAVDEMFCDAMIAPSTALNRDAGLPNVATLHTLLRGLARDVWHRAA